MTVPIPEVSLLPGLDPNEKQRQMRFFRAPIFDILHVLSHLAISNATPPCHIAYQPSPNIPYQSMTENGEGIDRYGPSGRGVEFVYERIALGRAAEVVTEEGFVSICRC